MEIANLFHPRIFWGKWRGVGISRFIGIGGEATHPNVYHARNTKDIVQGRYSGVLVERSLSRARSDDTLETIHRRIQATTQFTAALQDYYQR